MFTRNLLAIRQGLVRACRQWLRQGITRSVESNRSDLVEKHSSNQFSTATRLLRDEKPSKPVIKDGATAPELMGGHVPGDDIRYTAQNAKNMAKETSKEMGGPGQSSKQESEWKTQGVHQGYITVKNATPLEGADMNRGKNGGKSDKGGKKGKKKKKK